jgi:hypothetical protein
MPMSTNCQKIILINVIRHNDRLWFLRPFYNGAFYIASKHDFDDQFFFARGSMYNCEDKSGFTKSDKNITTKLKTFI